MSKGVIKSLKDKGYGFITQEGGESDGDLFFHMNDLNGVSFDDLKPGDNVTFDITEGRKGPQASNVHRVDAAGGDAE